MAAIAPPAVPLPPAPARTLFQFVAGVGAPVPDEATWTVAHDSPLIDSLAFLPWNIQAPPARTSVSRSAVVGAVLLAARQPLQAEVAPLRAMSFLTHEFLTAEASAILHEFDVARAFDVTYRTADAWQAAVPLLWGKLADPNAVRLQSGFFYETDEYRTRAAACPAELAFYYSANLADLALVDAAVAADAPCVSLSRATFLAASKDTHAIRNDETSTLRLIAERVKGLLLKMLDLPTASDAGLARKFIDAMAACILPMCYRKVTVSSMDACTELLAAHAFAYGNAAEVQTVEQARILRVGGVYRDLGSVVSRFTDPLAAWVSFESLSTTLLPAALARASTITKLASLNSKLATAAWRAFVQHAVNANAAISGSDLTEAMLLSHNDLSAPVSGAAASAPPPLGDGNATPATAAPGAIRDTAIADALRADEARTALDEAAAQEGVERVETIMQSGALLLLRAMLFQESWLLNKTTDLSAFSLDASYICPYFARMLTLDDDTDEVPERLKSFVFKPSYLTTIRTGTWSKLPILEIAIELRSLLTGAAFAPVAASERYVVDSCLLLIKEVGGRFFFAIGFSLSPQLGKSFQSAVELQRRAVAFARTLPPTEQAERLRFLSNEFETNLIDHAGANWLTCVSTGRPDLPSARIDGFAREDGPYFHNVTTWLRRAEPISDLRAALPSLLSAAPVSLPGCSTAPNPNPNLGGGGGDKGNKNKGKNKANGKEGPGSKASFCYAINDNEFFHCGVVFLKDKVEAKFKLPADACLPVMFTKKQGDNALELCPDPKKHGGMKAACHRRPAKFDLNYCYQHCTRKATKEELDQAGWTAQKKHKP